MGLKLLHSIWEWIHLSFSLVEPVDSAAPSDQERAISVFTNCLYTVRLAGQRIEFGRTRFPLPQSVLHSQPEIALAVLIQACDSCTKNPIRSETLNSAILNRAKLPWRRRQFAADPYRAFAILKEGINKRSGKLRVLRELTALPA